MKNKKISIINISKSFGDLKVFTDFSLDIPYNQSFMIMGKSGCGKTTLLRLLMELEKLDSGKITGMKDLKISTVFQEHRLVPGTKVWDNLHFVLPNTFSKEEKATQIGTLLEKLQLSNLESELVDNLSGGMARRVSIGRALLADFDLLILDEPFQGLDEHTKEMTAKVILGYAKGKTLILVSHEKEDADLFKIETANIITL